MASAERLTVLFVLFFNLWISGKTEILATIFYTEFSTRKVDLLSFFTNELLFKSKHSV